MPITADIIQQAVIKVLPDAHIELTDMVGDKNHYSLIVSSNAFVGKTRVAQHRLVNKALDGILGTELHALQIKTISK